ncbi:LacI family DNA-binding transcriptional regulator [Herbiconiux daphne]|uniref:LacI family DNA-binding transcriptional regulator n=1 Tax=Herbiconiux daphne TaxID=2970914 RepID=A0ABT2H458_9MICO|nr:LacI family DNA-binding transcriptional regulator [Herbiconiux daphne]MCS5734716.1 LacI family DNA-binding transcriptional regulator [Herbiconiux daphne]
MVDVAKLAGVSQQTVSRVVNNATNVSPDIRERVETAIEQLRYRRNTAAAALASNRTMNLGVVSYALSVHGPSVALFGISEEARLNGYSTRLITIGSLDRASMRAALRELNSDEVDGVIVLAPLYSAVEMLRGIETDVPVITFEQGSPETSMSVSIDEVTGARRVVRHLLDLGHETVWHVEGPPGWMASTARHRGWSAELSAAGRVVPPVVTTADWSAESGYRAGLELADRPGITAVFAANDPFALGVMKAFDERRIAVPADVSVVGFDDVAEARYFQPALTTVVLDFEEVGRVAVERILAMMRGEDAETIPLIEPMLVVRDSTAPPPERG